MTVRPIAHLLVALAGLALLLICAPAARGHAVLVATHPAAQQIIAEAPEAVRLTFSERVSLRLGGVEIFAPSGGSASAGRAFASGSDVTAPMRAEALGDYAVSWRVLSADGHPVRGAFVFSVGERSANEAGQRRAFAAAATDRPLAISFGLVRFLYVAGIVVAVGGAVFAVVVAKRWSPWLLVPALLIVIVGSALGFVFEAAIAADVAVTDVFNRTILEAQASTVYGNAALARIALAVLGLLALRLAPADPVARLLACGVLVALAVSLSLSGHAMSTEPMALRVPLDMVHVVVAATWAGGLVQLHRYLSCDDASPETVVRYSRVALISVIVLVTTGLYAALAESDLSLTALVDTAYGRILGLKLALFGLTLSIANLNRTRNVPAIAAGAPDARARLKWFVRIEIAILVAVIGLTAWLIETAPARHARHQVAQPPAPIEETRILASGARVRLSVNPAVVGTNVITVTVRRPDGRADGAVDAVELTGSLAERRIDRLAIRLRRRGGGRWVATEEVLPVAGRWRFDLAVRRGEFDEERTHIDGDIRRPISP